MKRPIIALDFSSQTEIDNFLSCFPAEESLFVKVGMELFYQEGPAIVRWLNKQGHDVFLDLKLHDIPNTVEHAMKGLAKLGVSMTNVHASGGSEMMMAAKRGLEAGTPKGGQVPLLIAVTQLTSTSETVMQTEQLIEKKLTESVTHYAKIAAKSGLDGVVCSAQEVSLIKKETSHSFICLTPGIRPEGSELADQKRVMTPGQARAVGSDHIVVGRPITQASDPFTMYKKILNQWNGVADNE